MKFLFVLLALCLVAAATDDMTCPCGEAFYKCTPTKCPKTCKEAQGTIVCPAVDSNCYQPGCLCKDDLLKNEDGNCVSFDECPKEDAIPKEKC